MFEEATRLKLRYPTARGDVTTEDLWDIPLLSVRSSFCLDKIASDLHDQLSESKKKSFVTKTSKADKTVKLKLNVVKAVIDYKVEEIERNKKTAINRNQKHKILNIIQEKEDEALKGTDIKKLKKMVKNL